MNKLFIHLRIWLRHLRDRRRYTLACDISPFPHPFNQEEQLFHMRGLNRAQSFAQHWVRRHPHGQARILKGWKEFPRISTEETT